MAMPSVPELISEIKFRHEKLMSGHPDQYYIRLSMRSLDPNASWFTYITNSCILQPFTSCAVKLDRNDIQIDYENIAQQLIGSLRDVTSCY